MWYKIKAQQVELRIYAKPNAKQTNFIAIKDQELHIALHAKPQEGAANKELIAYLSKFFHAPKSQICLISGEGSRHKKVTLPLTDRVLSMIDKKSIDG